jgi:hypothetical protein
VTRLLVDNALMRRVAFYKTQDNVEVEAQAATDTLYGGQLHRLRRIHDETGNIRGDTLDTVQVAPIHDRHFSTGRFNLGQTHKKGKYDVSPHGVLKPSPTNYQNRPGQFNYNQSQQGKPKSRVPPQVMLATGTGKGKENFGGQFPMSSPFKGRATGKSPQIRRPGHPIIEHPGKKVATAAAFMEAVKILKGQEDKRSGARSASAPVQHARSATVQAAGPVPRAGGTASRAAKPVAESQRGAAQAAKPVERVTHAAPKPAARAIEIQDPATLAEQFRAKSNLLASRWAPAAAQPRAPEPEPMALDPVETPSLSASPSVPQAAPPRTPVAESPRLSGSASTPQAAPTRAPVAEAATLPVRPRPRVPSELSLATSRWAVPGLIAGHAVRNGASGEPSSGCPQPREVGRLTPVEFSSSDEEMASQSSPGRYGATATPMTKSTLAPGFLYALSLGNAARSDSKILDVAEQFMMDE